MQLEKTVITENRIRREKDFLSAMAKAYVLTSARPYVSDEQKLRSWIQASLMIMKRFNVDGVDFKHILDAEQIDLIISSNILNLTQVNQLDFAIQTIVGNIEVNHIIHEMLNGDINSIELNDDWKAKASSYVSHIRTAVAKAEVSEGLRERIFSKLNELQSEIDKNRTRVQSLTEVFLAITEAMSKGSKHLDAPMKLLERLSGALSGVRHATIEHKPQLQLPAPESLGLSELDD
jgi:hypothetical protein